MDVFSSQRFARTLPLLALLVLFLALPVIVFLVPHRQSANAQAAAISPQFPSLPDTTNNIHVGQAFNYNISNQQVEAGKIGYVWGSQFPNQPTGVYNTYYIPYDSDQNPAYNPAAHDLAWWKASHPDWIEYKCDRTTVAYLFSNPNIPLDFTNPAVQTYIQATFLVPALQQGYQGIGFDDPAFRNFGSWTGQRCGHYNTSGNWVQQFTGTEDDPAYRQGIINWAKSMQTWFHTQQPRATMSVNFSFDPEFAGDSATLLSYIDFDVDEQGFTNGNNGPPWYYDGSTWLAKIQSLQQFLALGRGWLSINQEPVSFSSLTNDQVNWVLANYLLLKNNASFVNISGYQQYGSLFTRPEYSAQIGSPINSMYPSQNVYMRDFTNGKTIVNPSSTQSFSVPLPANTYKDVYGNTMNALTLGVHSGIVLLNANGPITSIPTPTPTGQVVPLSTPPPAPSASPAPSSKEYTLYGGVLTPGWTNWSYRSTVKFANTFPKRQHRIAAAFNVGYATLYLHNDTGVPTQPYTYLSFAAQAATANQHYVVFLMDASNQRLSAQMPLANYGGDPVQGVWKYYKIPLSALGANGKVIKGFVLQNGRSIGKQLLYVDGIKLVA